MATRQHETRLVKEDDGLFYLERRTVAGWERVTLQLANRATRELVRHPIDLQAQIRNDDGTVLDATGAAGKFKIVNGTHSAPALKLQGVTANNNTKTDYCSFVFQLPAEYVAGSDLTIGVTVDLVGAGTAGTNTIDVSAYELSTAGAVGSDLCATAAQNLAASATTRTFTITGTGLVAGDKLLVYLTQVLAESASTDLVGTITDVAVNCDLK